MIDRFVEWLKSALLEVQEYVLMVGKFLRALVSRPFYFRDLIEQFDAIGVGSLTVVLLTGMFTGMVLALQSGFTLDQFGARSMVGRLVSASIIKELGPVLTGLMVAGRVGSGIAAELGSMMVTDQIAALRALGTDPIRKLVVPRILAGIVMVPILTVIASAIGMVGGWLVTVDAAARGLVGLLECGRAGAVHSRRLDGPDQAVLSRLHDRQHRLPCRSAHARRHAGRRPRHDQRGRGQLGGRHRGRLPGHAVADRADVLMASEHTGHRPALLDEALGPGGPIIVFDNVWLAFDDKVILRDVSFTLQTAHTKIFLGASGAGKSTILRLILGLLKPDQGRIFVNGEEIDSMHEDQLMAVRADLGMVFQEGALFDSLTVRENVGYKLFEELYWPIDKANARVEEVLGFIGLAEFIDRMPSELSGGQRRRVAIARAMAAKPRILLYDEPTTGLDPITALTVDEEIIKLRDLEGVSSILVTHQLRDAFFVAEHSAARDGRDVRFDRAEGRKADEAEFIMLRDGRIAFEGNAAELRAAAEKDQYIQAFLS